MIPMKYEHSLTNTFIPLIEHQLLVLFEVRHPVIAGDQSMPIHHNQVWDVLDTEYIH